MKITFIFPSRSRPTKFFNTLDVIRNLCKSDNYEVICALDEDDVTMNNDGVRKNLGAYKNVKYFYGTSTGKINACNREIDKISSDASIVILQSDDMRWEQHGFDDVIRESFTKHFPDCDGVLHTNDGKVGIRTMTLTIMGIKLLKQLGYLYYPDYISVYADNDLTELTRMMGKYVYVDKVLCRHFHPIYNLTSWDLQYRQTESKENYKHDKKIFEKRKSENFGL